MNYFNCLVEQNKIKRDTVLFHRVGTLGLGALLSRLMVGLNLSLANDFDFAYDISGTYCIDKFFVQNFNKNRKDYKNEYEWDFFKDTWNCDNKFVHIYPKCPYKNWQHLTRHQWNILLAQCICGLPTERLERVKNNFKQRVNWDSFAMHIGLHIRCGDKEAENPFIPISVYCKYVSMILQQYTNLKIGIYLTSDNDESYSQVKELLDVYPNVTILWDDQEKRYNNCNCEFVLKNPQYIEQETETGCKAISLLGDCEYVVGMSSAQFTWLGGLLSAYKRNFSEENHLMINPRTHQLDHWGAFFCTRG